MNALIAALAVSLSNSPAPEAAPTFALKGADGKEYRLEDYRGKYVVLEWWNYQCPIVARHYSAGNIQRQQKDLTGKGVIWLTIAGSAEGKQGFVGADEARKVMTEKGGAPTAILLNPAGDVGMKYKAKTTPHVFLISPKGEILYDGAIDDNPSGRNKEVNDLLLTAYAEASSGKPVTVAKSQPYGCGIKYP